MVSLVEGGDRKKNWEETKKWEEWGGYEKVVDLSLSLVVYGWRFGF